MVAIAMVRRSEMTISSRAKQSISLHQPVKIPERVLFRELEGELVLLSLERGTYFSLDPIGTRIWQLLHPCHGDLSQVLAKLLEEFAVEEERCRNDLLAFAASLCEHGLLEPVLPLSS